jgi:diguanylate cyclase (GGDEF)-like protein
MLQIDVISAYVICGAGSLAGAAMMSLARPDEPRLRKALRAFVWGFVALGVGLFQLAAGDVEPAPLAMLVALEGTVLGLAIFAAGFAQLGGGALTSATLPTSAVLSLLAIAVTQFLDARLLAITFVLASTLLACMIAWSLRHVLQRPRHLAERVMSLIMVAHAASWLLRSAYTIAYQGPTRIHQLHVPDALVTPFAVYYCVMPVVVAALVLNVVNARLSQQLRSRAMTDELTGATTRRALRELAPAMIHQAQQGGAQVAVLMLDLDHFKAVNDQSGHQAGDEVLRHCARLMTSNLRPDALLTRYGGEEFVVLAPVADMPTARVVAERLRSVVAAEPCRVGGAAIRVTISVGVALLEPDEALEPALQRADAALYRAKRNGRDRVESSIEAA